MSDFDLTPYLPWIWFYGFGGLTVLAALGVVLHKKVVYNAVFLALALLGVAALFITLNADFLGVVQVLLYVGGVVVLVLFSILLTRGEAKGGTYLNRNKQNVPAALVGLGFTIWASIQLASVSWPNAYDSLARKYTNSGFGEFATIKPFPLTPGQPIILNQTYPISIFGDALMKPYLLIFELASLILLVAMVGVVVYMKNASKKSVPDGSASKKSIPDGSIVEEKE
ncbi:NADH-quinone oxidoreductase subunit J [bacterium]|nr:NADH-quinone oxidoreductase subunit J [bacterium]